MHTRCSGTLGLVIVSAAVGQVAGSAAPASEGVEYFEERVRPIVAEQCYSCHGPMRQRSGLRLDSLEALRQGGDRGPALVPEDPDKSLLIRAVRYTDEELRMPPKSRLSEEQIQDLITWVKMGAPGPTS